MKIVKKIKTGSSIFFNKFEDFNTKDTDWIVFVDNFAIKDKIMMRCKIGKDDIMMYRSDVTKQDMIDNIYNSKTSMKIAQFLTPEFVDYFKVTIDDLKTLIPISEEIDEKHKYLKLILDFYIENNDFVLSDEQLYTAYTEYKKLRGNRTNKKYNIIKKIKVGSSVFFSKYDDYKIKDNDWIALSDDIDDINTVIIDRFKKQDGRIFSSKISKDYFINELLTSKSLPMNLCSFLVKDFIEHFNVTIDDLKLLESISNNLDNKHKYLKIIYDAYIENNDFILTEEQLDSAYTIYKKYRKL